MLNTDKRSIPNMITGFRLLGAVVLLFLVPFSVEYYIVYTLCGISDILDGFLARRMHSSTEKGAVLDSVADLLFYSALIYRLIPYLIPRIWSVVWYLFAAVLAVRLLSYLVAAIKYRRFASLHTYGNKLTGCAVFSIPYALLLPDQTVVCLVICTIGGLASLEELLIHLRAETYQSNIKSILQIAK